MARVLFANDDPEYTATCTAMLEQAGHRVEPFVVTGAELLLTLAREHFDAAVIDARLGGPLSADQLIEAMRRDKRTRSMPILLLGSPAGEAAQAADRVLRKPFTPEELIIALNELIAARPTD